MDVPKARRHFSAPHIHGVASETPSGESEEEGGDAEGDASPAPAPQPMTYIRPMADGKAPRAPRRAGPPRPHAAAVSDASLRSRDAPRIPRPPAVSVGGGGGRRRGRCLPRTSSTANDIPAVDGRDITLPVVHHNSHQAIVVVSTAVREWTSPSNLCHGAGECR